MIDLWDSDEKMNKVEDFTRSLNYLLLQIHESERARWNFEFKFTKLHELLFYSFFFFWKNFVEKQSFDRAPKSYGGGQKSRFL